MSRDVAELYRFSYVACNSEVTLFDHVKENSEVIPNWVCYRVLHGDPLAVKRLQSDLCFILLDDLSSWEIFRSPQLRTRLDDSRHSQCHESAAASTVTRAN